MVTSFLAVPGTKNKRRIIRCGFPIKLWKHLINRKMNKKAPTEQTGISSAMTTKLSNVRMSILKSSL